MRMTRLLPGRRTGGRAATTSRSTAPTGEGVCVRERSVANDRGESVGGCVGMAGAKCEYLGGASGRVCMWGRMRETGDSMD